MELSRGILVTLHRGSTQPADVDRLLRTVRAYPGNLDLYLEILGLAKVRRAIYKVGANLKIRHDERMLADLETTFGLENIRLIGHGGTAGRDEGRNRPSRPPASFDQDAEVGVEHVPQRFTDLGRQRSRRQRQQSSHAQRGSDRAETAHHTSPFS